MERTIEEKINVILDKFDLYKSGLTEEQKYKRLEKIRKKYRNDLEISQAFLKMSHDVLEKQKFNDRISKDLNKIVEIGYYMTYIMPKDIETKNFDNETSIFFFDKQELAKYNENHQKMNEIIEFVLENQPKKLQQLFWQDKFASPIEKRKMAETIAEYNLNPDNFANMLEVQQLMYLRKLRSLYFELLKISPGIACDHDYSELLFEYIRFISCEKGISISNQIKYLSKEEQLENIDWYLKRQNPYKKILENERLKYFKDYNFSDVTSLSPLERKEYVKVLKKSRRKFNVRASRFNEN